MAIAQMDITGWLRGKTIDHDRLWSLNEQSNRVVRWGHMLYITSACVFCLFIALPQSFFEVSSAVLVGFFVVRLYAMWRLYPPMLSLPIVSLAILYTLYTAIGILWSPNQVYGFHEFDVTRWILVVPALWPLRHLRRWFIFCIILSYLTVNSVQLIQFLALEFGWESLDFDAYPDRISAWYMPASGGSILLASFGLHLPIALNRRHSLRWPARVLSIIALLAVIATGARGAWIAAALLTTLAVGITIWQSSHRTRTLVTAVIIAAVVLPVAWFALGSKIESRVVEARTELRRTIEDKDFATSMGARVNMWIWAGRAFAEHPILGTGTGSYQTWVKAEQTELGIDLVKEPIERNAHGAYVHIAATQGLVGLILFGALLTAVLIGAAPNASDISTYQAGLFMAIVGVVIVGIFATYHLHTQTAAVLCTLVALSQRPSNPQ
jgi:O-antigen ligase